MLETILLILKIMGWLGITLEILVAVNIITNTIVNTWTKHETFSWKKLLQGIGKSLVFYFGAICLSIAFTMIPYINTMIAEAFSITLFSEEVLTTLSGIGVLGIVVSAITLQAKKAIEGITRIATINFNNDESNNNLNN